MSFDPFTAAFELGKVAIEKIWPDPTKRSEEMRKLTELQQQGDLAELNAYVVLLQGQLEVNKVEAAHASLFVAGWRPFIGWVGGFSLLYAGVIYPLLSWVWGALVVMGYVPPDVVPPPYIDSALLGTIVTGMLGIGTMRTYEKKNGTARDAISTPKK
jgi:hypothetical protein